MAIEQALAPWASRVRKKRSALYVSLRRSLDTDSVFEFLSSKALPRIVGLRIPGSVGPFGLRAIVTSKAFVNLRSIAIYGFEDADEAVDTVFESPLAKRLRVLKVWGVSDAIDTRLGRGNAKMLRQLDIRNSPELTSLDRYFESPYIGSLRFLSIERTGLTDATMLLHNSHASNLRTLSLAASELDPETVECLCTSKHIQGLRKLNLSHNRRDDVHASVYALLRSKSLQQLQQLVLCGCDISDLYWERVSFPQLATLDLRDNPLSLDEMFEILEATGLPQLKRLVANTPEGFTRGELDKRLVIDDTRPPWA